MNRNQKIALGCGGGGCLGLILLVIVCAVLIVSGVIKAPGLYSPNSNNRNYNYNYNRNSNTNADDNLNSNSDSSSSSMSEDDKHKLYQAAGMTKDNALMLRVIKKVGLGDGTGSDHQEFIKAHFAWAMKNISFIQSVNSPDAARAYVEAHIDD
jgi:predicted metalloprotease